MKVAEHIGIKFKKKRTFVGCLLQNKSAELCKEKMQRTALY